MTYETLEGILVVVVGLSQWTCTHEGIISLDLHGGLNPIDGC